MDLATSIIILRTSFGSTSVIYSSPFYLFSYNDLNVMQEFTQDEI